MRHRFLWLVLALLPTACTTYYTSNDPYVVGVRWFDRNQFAYAKQLWEPLANSGDCDAQYRIGAMYFLGAGVPEDHKTAYKWLSLAANQGQAFAQHLLGVMYAHGYSELRNLHMIMAFNCVSGCGIEKDMLVAYQWNLLAERNTPYENFRPLLEHYTAKYKSSLTPEQVFKAQNYVNAWTASPAQCKQRKVL